MSVAIGGNYSNNYSLFDVDPAVDAKPPTATEDHAAVPSENQGLAALSDVLKKRWSPTPTPTPTPPPISDGYENLTGKDAFHQGQKGNCVAVAVIKTAEDKFGDKIFKSKQSDGQGGLNVTLRNNEQVHVSAAELKAARAAADFEGGQGSAALKLAYIAYAVMAKGAAAQRGESYDDALKDLADGEKPSEVPSLLGLAVETLSPSQLNETNLDAVMICAGIKNPRGDHELYVNMNNDNGKTVDVYGSGQQLTQADKSGLKWKFSLPDGVYGGGSRSPLNILTLVDQSDIPNPFYFA